MFYRQQVFGNVPWLESTENYKEHFQNKKKKNDKDMTELLGATTTRVSLVKIKRLSGGTASF